MVDALLTRIKTMGGKKPAETCTDGNEATLSLQLEWRNVKSTAWTVDTIPRADLGRAGTPDSTTNRSTRRVGSPPRRQRRVDTRGTAAGEVRA